MVELLREPTLCPFGWPHLEKGDHTPPPSAGRLDSGVGRDMVIDQVCTHSVLPRSGVDVSSKVVQVVHGRQRHGGRLLQVAFVYRLSEQPAVFFPRSYHRGLSAGRM